MNCAFEALVGAARAELVGVAFDRAVPNCRATYPARRWIRCGLSLMTVGVTVAPLQNADGEVAGYAIILF